MRLARGIATSFAVLLTACPAPHPAPDGGGTCPPGQRPVGATRTCRPIGWSACPAGFLDDDSGVGCVDALVTGCPPGTAALLGEPSCVPLGPSTCAAGFAKDPSGFGCADVLPRTGCGGATRAALGNTACVPVGDCAAPFPPAGSSVVVDPAAPLDATHVHTLADALARVPDGGIIAIAAGTYVETVSPGHSVSIVGRCPSLVTLDGTGSTQPVLSVLGEQDSQVSGVTITNAATAVVAAYGAHLFLHDVVIDGSRGEAVSAFWPKTTLSLSGSVIRGTRFTGSNLDGTWGQALQVSDHAQVSVKDTAFEDTDLVGVRARGLGTSLALTGAVVRDVWLPDAGVAPMGAVVEAGGTLSIQSSLIAGATQVAVYVAGADSTATVTDSVLRDSRATATLSGFGAYVQEGRLTLRRVTEVHATGIGVVVDTAAAHLWGEDVVIRGTRPVDDGGVGAGLDVEAGDATLTGLVVLDSVIVGVRVTNPGASLTLDRALIRGTTGVPEDGISAGHGLEVTLGARGTFTRVSLDSLSEGGASVQDDGSTATLDRVHIAGAEAVGLFVREGATATVTRSAVVGARDTGVFVYDRSSLSLIDSVVRDTRPAVGPGGNPGIGLAGLGTGAVVVQRSALVNNGVFGMLLDGAHARLESSRIAGTRGLAAKEYGGGVQLQGATDVTMDGVVVEDNDRIAVACTESSTASIAHAWLGTAKSLANRYGHGLMVFRGGGAMVRDVSVRGNDVIGVVDASGAAVLDACDVSDNLVALHVQDGTGVVEATDLPASPPANTLLVSHDTTFLGNQARLGSGQVPLPATLPLSH